MRAYYVATQTHFRHLFWEVLEKGDKWEFLQSTVKITQTYDGRESILLWENGQGQLRELAKELRERLHDADHRGNQAWGKRGVCVSQMRVLSCTLYTGGLFDNNTAVILPKDSEHLLAIWAFCQSPEFNAAVRRIDQKMNVTNATLVKVPFDLEYWQKVADEAGPLPEPYSNDRHNGSLGIQWTQPILYKLQLLVCLAIDGLNKNLIYSILIPIKRASFAYHL